MRRHIFCSQYAYQYSSCIDQAVGDDVTIGQAPYSTTYHSPCRQLSEAIGWLEDFSRYNLAAPFCDAPDSSYYDVCQAYLPATPPPTTTTVATTRSTTARVAGTSAAATKATPDTTKPQTSTGEASMEQSSISSINGGVPAFTPQGPTVGTQPPPAPSQPAPTPASGSASAPPASGPGLTPASTSGVGSVAGQQDGASPASVGPASPSPAIAPKVTTTYKPTSSTKRHAIANSSASTSVPNSTAYWKYLVTLWFCLRASLVA